MIKCMCDQVGVRGLPARGIFFLGAMGLGSGHLEIFVFRLLNKNAILITMNAILITMNAILITMNAILITMNFILITMNARGPGPGPWRSW